MILANVLQPLVDVFESVLVFFHDDVGLGWGLSIIALTVCVRALLVPLTVKQFKSMQGMQRIAPEMKKLQEKYKDDKQRQQQELMALYKEHKVNPFSSCLPLVAQLPVFLSLFYMLRKDLRMDICGQTAKACGAVHHPERFLFVPDITGKATGLVLVVLLVLYVGSQLISSVLMSVSADRNQRMLMIFLPFAFTPFIVGFPAGLIVYWITTNLWTVGQGYLVRRSFPPPPSPDGTPPPKSLAASLIDRARGKDDAASEPARPAASRSSGDEAKPAKPAKSGKTATAAPSKPAATPPRPPRQKKKRSGRRR